MANINAFHEKHYRLTGRVLSSLDKGYIVYLTFGQWWRGSTEDSQSFWFTHVDWDHALGCAHFPLPLAYGHSNSGIGVEATTHSWRIHIVATRSTNYYDAILVNANPIYVLTVWTMICWQLSCSDWAACDGTGEDQIIWLQKCSQCH